jgi:hypothetical protein
VYIFRGLRQLKRGINVIIPLRESIFSMNVTIFESPPYFCLPKDSLQAETCSEEKSSTNLLLVPTTLPKQDVSE